jgi:hypothetical protein
LWEDIFGAVGANVGFGKVLGFEAESWTLKRVLSGQGEERRPRWGKKRGICTCQTSKERRLSMSDSPSCMGYSKNESVESGVIGFGPSTIGAVHKGVGAK